MRRTANMLLSANRLYIVKKGNSQGSLSEKEIMYIDSDSVIHNVTRNTEITDWMENVEVNDFVLKECQTHFLNHKMEVIKI
jgi:hypothetical protein